ncbi:uncharacterized protein [Hetaerina americana]|uniref:uncharacterized protein n=1 Tax=Hetaerina americana TaxID=62018 RepID=UPI003A7F410F
MIEMDTIVEELQLLSLWEEDIKTRKSEFITQFSKAVRGLLDLYHITFQEKNDLNESFAQQAVEIRELKQAKYRLEADCSKQATLITNLKLREENLLAKVEASSQEQERLRKKVLEERLKWRRRSQLERFPLQKAQQEVSALKDELRKIMYTASSKTTKNGELLVEGGSIQILNNHLKINPDTHEQRNSLKEDILRKSLRRLDSSQRVLVEESASLCSSLQAINSNIQKAVNALKVYIAQDGEHEFWDSLKPKSEPEDDKSEAPTWLPLLVSNTQQMCTELNELVEALLKMSSHSNGGVSGEAVRKYVHSFCSYENVLDSALESICLK